MNRYVNNGGQLYSREEYKAAYQRGVQDERLRCILAIHEAAQEHGNPAGGDASRALRAAHARIVEPERKP